MRPPRPPTGGLTIWVPCELKNYANHGGHWTGKARYQRALRDKTHIHALERRDTWDHGHDKAETPKNVMLEMHVWNYFDEHDGLRNACKPIVDGLVNAGVIDNDAPSSGHLFLYTQILNRKMRGVLITVTPR